MITRPFWLKKIKSAWKSRSIVWLSGVRRVGKTTLTKMLKPDIYLNCDLPSTQRLLEDPEFYLSNLDSNSVIVFDEIHRLGNPSQLLKIAADEFPSLKIIATGSSTLAATKKFRDSLTGRKAMIHLTPVLWTETNEQFKINDLTERLLRGGMPEMLLADALKPEYFSEWLDSFYARDIQELFGIRNRTGFLNVFKLLLRQSGSLADYTQLAKLSGLSRPTVMAHLEALTIAHAIHIVYPFHGGSRKELTRRPKIYGFDTGFIAFSRGWDKLRPEDLGPLWEHLVLDTLKSTQNKPIYFWRDKSQREIDFIIKGPGNAVDAYECKINPDSFNPKSLQVFRKIYPEGKNFVISPVVKEPFFKRYSDLSVAFSSLKPFC